MNKIIKLEKMVGSGVTLLGAGPMSKISTDVIIDLAQKFDLLIAMIPSKRQVECEELGGGYVNNWTTETFSAYVKHRDEKQNIILSRDHCGPWQSEKSVTKNTQTNLAEEMHEVKISLKSDIASGFDCIHIDPSLGLQNGLNQAEVLNIAFQMVDFCESLRTPGNGELIYEIGTEEQTYSASSIRLNENELKQILAGLSARGLPKPKFYVAQTGTKVKELKNVGSFDHQLDSKGILPASYQVPKVLELCARNDVWLKEHNADYLSDNALAWHRRFGIHAANIAPEFGVAETRALIKLAQLIKADELIFQMLETVNEKGKWKKWILENTQVSDYDKMLIAGHYHFSEPWHVEWRNQLEFLLKKRKINLHEELYLAITNCVNRILVNFGYNVA